MAIYSLHHQPIGKSTQARPHTSAAHVRYITRPSAASRIEAGRMPAKPRDAAAFMVEAENGDRKNGRVSDKLMLALPRELDAEQRAALVRGYAEDVTQGRAPWLAAFHDQGKDAQNPHAHLVIRDRDPATGKRVAGLSEKGSTERLRALWEDHANRALERAGRPERIDRRTLEAQGVERAPTVHEGPKAQQMERRGAQPESRLRRYRNRPGSRLPHRQVDYRGIDGGRSRPAYNRQLRETPADYWQALDADNQARELDQLRAIHHRPDSVIAFPARRPVTHGIVNHNGFSASVPGVHGSGLTGLLSPPLAQSSLLLPVPPIDQGKVSTPQGIARGASPKNSLAPPEGPTEQPAKPIEQNINHSPIIRNNILSDKGKMMSVDDEEKQRLEQDLADARAREGKSRAARDIALENGFMRPKLAGPAIDKYYKNNGLDALKARFNEYPGASQFGVKKGNIFTSEGRGKRANANQARRDLPDLWHRHAEDYKNWEAADRAFNDRYPQQQRQTAPPTEPARNPGMSPPQGPQPPAMTPIQQPMSQRTPPDAPPRQAPQRQPTAPTHQRMGQDARLAPSQQPIAAPGQPRAPVGAQPPSFLSHLPNAQPTGKQPEGRSAPAMDNLQYPPPSFLSKLPNAHRTPMDGRPPEGRPPKTRPGRKPRGGRIEDD